MIHARQKDKFRNDLTTFSTPNINIEDVSLFNIG